jgi:hypothetical protein
VTRPANRERITAVGWSASRRELWRQVTWRNSSHHTSRPQTELIWLDRYPLLVID